MNRLSLIILLSLISTPLFSQSEQEGLHSNETMKSLLHKVKGILQKYYPDATVQLFKNEIKFEYKTREFVVHNALKTGEWQGPSVARGPSKGGALGTIEFRTGTWGGAAKVPQVFNYRYYSVLLLAPYQEKENFHLYSRIYSPSSGYNKEFIEEITKLINSPITQSSR